MYWYHCTAAQTLQYVQVMRTTCRLAAFARSDLDRSELYLPWWIARPAAFAVEPLLLCFLGLRRSLVVLMCWHTRQEKLVQ